MKLRKFYASVAGLIMAMNIIPAVVAQESSDRILEEILVTAQKREEALKDVPISVNVLSEEYLDKANISNFSDIQYLTPGVYMNGPADGFGQGVTIRGVGSQPFVSGIAPGVTFVLNDVPLARLESLFTNISDVEQLLILKGPQATLYGKEASSGVIAITTRKPSLEGIEGDIGVESGSNDLQQFRGRINVPMGDKFAASLSAYSTQFDGEVTNILTGKEQNDEQFGARVSLLYQPTDSLEVLYRYSQTNQKVRNEVRERKVIGLAIPDTYTLPADPFDDKIETLLPNGRDSEINSSTLHINWAINEQWGLSSITGYNYFNRELNKGAPLPVDITGFGGFGITIPAGTPTGGDGAFTPVPFVLVYSDGTPKDETIKTQEFRLTFDNDKWSSLYGAFYSKTDESANTSLFIAAVAGGLPLQLVSTREFIDWSFFTHQTWHVNEKWDITGGIRYGENERTIVGGDAVGAGQFGDGTSPIGEQQNDTWDNVSGSFKVVYNASESISFYGGVSTGYKPGGFNDTPSDPQFDEETTISYEAGLKGIFLDNMLRLNASVFYQTYDDYQVQSFDPDRGSTVNIISNAASAEVTGVEFDFVWLVGENITVEGGIAYVNARYDNYKNSPCNDAQLLALSGSPVGTTAMGCTLNAGLGAGDAFTSQDLGGKRLFQTSPFTGNLVLTYQGMISDILAWSARGSIAYRDDYWGFNTLEPGGRQDAYILVDASVGLQSVNGDWEVSLYGKNLTDKNYIAGFLPGRDGPLGINAIKGLGSTYGLKAKYNF